MLYTLRSNELYVTEHWVVGSIAMLLIPQSYVFDVVEQCFRGNWAALLLLCHTDITDPTDSANASSIMVQEVQRVQYAARRNLKKILFKIATTDYTDFTDTLKYMNNFLK